MCVAFAHGDDVVVGVHLSSSLAWRKFEELRATWNWGSWEVNGFVQMWILITQLASRNMAQVTMIDGWQKPKDQWVDDDLPPGRKTACRPLRGLQFLASQGMALFAAETSITSSCLNEGSSGTVASTR